MLRCIPFRVVVFAAALVASIGRAGAQTVPATPAAQPDDAFFDDTLLHTIFVSMNTKDWQALQEHALDNTYYPADLRWNSQVVRNIGIRSRGTGSRSGIKPGLRVDFDRYSTDQKFLGLKSVVLRNNTQDASGLHERISMALFRRLGLPAPREAHTKLYINNAYAGLYTIVESVDKAYVQRTYGEDEGYLFKYDYNVGDLPYYFESRGPDGDLYVPHPFKPETHESDPHAEILAALVDTINIDDSQLVFRSTIEGFLDLAKFVQHIAVEAFLADTDGFNGDWGMNNFYMYRMAAGNLFRIIPWDKSEAFKGGVESSIWRNIAGLASWRPNRLTRRALRDADLRTLFLDTLDAAANVTAERDPAAPSDSRGWMEREIDREYQQIRDWAALAPADQAVFSREQFEQEVDNLRTFARERPDFVRQESASSR